MGFNLTCNSTLEEMRILPGSEIPIAGALTFHQLALVIAAASTLVAIVMSLYLIMMHATHYTKPREQKHIIRILFMVPVYATSSFLSLRFYWHAIYFQVISDCYEAFAISAFFALLCHYIAPDLHEQKEFFRLMQPIQGWVWPLNWFRKCCGGDRGPWRTPKSGLTWFNINWIGVYQYCFIRVAMTISAVGSQYFDRYCESSNSPVFGHIWIISIDALSVTVAMFCLIQFYVQLRVPLAEYSPFLKVLAIKLVIFLSFWQSSAISVGTSTLDIVKPNKVIAYPDLKVGIPSLLLCFEMAVFAILHLWAFPYRPYLDSAKPTFYPAPDPALGLPPRENEHIPRAGGPLGLLALWDALNLWDIVKAFGRGMRWLFVGVKHRHQDPSYHQAAVARKNSAAGESSVNMSDLGPSSRNGGGGKDGVDTAYVGGRLGARSTDHLPIASEFRRSRYGVTENYGAPDYAEEGGRTAGTAGRPGHQQQHGGAYLGVDGRRGRGAKEEHAGLIAHAQPDPHSPGVQIMREPGSRGHEYDDDDDFSYAAPAPYGGGGGAGSASLSTVDEEPYDSRLGSYGGGAYGGSANPRNSTQARLGDALWGPRHHPQDGGPGPR